MKTITTTLAIARSPGTLLLNLQLTPRGLPMPWPWEILHTRTHKCPGQPSQPVDFEEILNYLISIKAIQKENWNKLYNARSLPELHQEVLFLSPSEPNAHDQGTITSPASTPRSYIMECQGRQYQWTRQHIHPLSYEIPTPISKPSTTHLPVAEPE